MQGSVWSGLLVLGRATTFLTVILIAPTGLSTAFINNLINNAGARDLIGEDIGKYVKHYRLRRTELCSLACNLPLRKWLTINL